MGAKKRPFYRVVIADARSPRDGRFIETIGHYDPLTEPSTIVINQERALHWISVGAQPTVAVTKLMLRAGIIEDRRTRRPAETTVDSPSPAVAIDAAPAEPGVEASAAAQEVAQEPLVVEQAPQDVESVTLEPTAAAQMDAQGPVAEDVTPETGADQPPAESPRA